MTQQANDRGVRAAVAQREQPRTSDVRIWKLREPGDSCIIRFQGLFAPPRTILPAKVIDQMGVDAIRAQLINLGAVHPGKDARAEGDPAKRHAAYRDALLRRYNEVEPRLRAQHYIPRYQGTNKIPFRWCADHMAVITGDRKGSECPLCEKNEEDGRGSAIGWAQVQNCYSIWNFNRSHKVGEKKWEPCTMLENGFCQHCERNERLPEKKRGQVFTNGREAMLLGDSYAALVIDCMRNLSHECRFMRERKKSGRLAPCGGKLRPLAASCPECEEALDLEQALGERSDFLNPVEVLCESCEETVIPELTFHCSKCGDTGLPTRLCDVNVKVTRTGTKGGRGRGRGTTNYNFAPILPIDPLSVDNEAHRPLLLSPLIDWDAVCVPPRGNDLKALLGMEGRGDDDDEDEDKPRRRKAGAGGRAPSAVNDGYFKARGGGAKPADDDDEETESFDDAPGIGDDDIPF